MLTGLAWLALEVKYLDPARSFYEERLDLSVRADAVDEVRYAAGDSELVLRRPSGVPRGGLHTHYACSIPVGEYDDWWDRLAATHELAESRFGDVRSLYLYDPDGNCVELGQRDVAGPGVDGIFEIALEVESLERAESFYEVLGFETVDRGEERRRVRMQGPVAIELWEPQLGIADARGGVHVDVGFRAPEPADTAAAVADRACEVEYGSDEAVIRDPDGHYLTVRSEDS